MSIADTQASQNKRLSAVAKLVARQNGLLNGLRELDADLAARELQIKVASLGAPNDAQKKELQELRKLRNETSQKFGQYNFNFYVELNSAAATSALAQQVNDLNGELKASLERAQAVVKGLENINKLIGLANSLLSGALAVAKVFV
jgi:seryl-tRNA synthetase